MNSHIQISLNPVAIEEIRNSLHVVNAKFQSLFPGDLLRPQPVHTVYGGAHLFKADTAKKMGDLALESLKRYAPESKTFAQALDLQEYGELVYARVIEKLKTQAVEDFRIDFEDGYGVRSDSEEDAHAQSAAQEVALGFQQKTLPPSIGIRIKPLTDEFFSRSLRTLDIFITTLVEKNQRKLPPGFIVTLPKITSPEQIQALTRVLRQLEFKLDLPHESVSLELMVETPQSVFNSKGEVALPSLVAAAQGRCVGVHFGAYDYLASCGMTSRQQDLKHESCRFARQVIQVSMAGTGISISDGATNLLPIGPHRVQPGQVLTSQQLEENQKSVHQAWKQNYEPIRYSLMNGYYQGWDLHPSQIPIRYAAVYTFFLENLHSASLRLKAFVEKSAQATQAAGVFDDAATGQGLMNFFIRGFGCGAFTESDVLQTGLTLDEVRSRSFSEILEGRRQGSRKNSGGMGVDPMSKEI